MHSSLSPGSEGREVGEEGGCERRVYRVGGCGGREG